MLKKNSWISPAIEHSFEQHWPNIEPIVKRLIFHEPISKGEWQDLIQDVYMICSWDEKGCNKLSKALEIQFTCLLIKEVRSRLLSIEDGQQQLKEYVDCWADFRRHCVMFPKAFQQLDLATRMLNPRSSKTIIKNKTPSAQSESTVRDLMLKLWDEKIVTPLFMRLRGSALELIFAERNGQIVDSQLIVGLRDSLVCLDSLAQADSKGCRESFNMFSFRESYLLEIEMFYTSRANDYLRERGVLEYIKWASNKIKKEEHRAELYLDSNPTVLEKITEACTKVLVANFVEQVLLESPQYIRTNDSDNLKYIFQFVDRVEGSADKLFKEFGNHMITTGLSYLTASEVTNCETYVEKLLESYNQFDQVIKEHFNNDLRAQTVLNEVFEIIVNDTKIFQSSFRELGSGLVTPINNSAMNKLGQPESRCSEMIASYCDLLLRRTTLSRKFSPEGLTKRLNEILLVIKFIKNKDVFMKHYKLYLTRRLILDITVSNEIEEQFAASLKELPGIPLDYMNKMSRMFKDLKDSENLQQSYKINLQSLANAENVNNNNNNTIQTLASKIASTLIVQDSDGEVPVKSQDHINLKILNPSAWTKTKDEFPVYIPNEIAMTIPALESFYHSQYTGRKLVWIHQFSNGIISFISDKGEYDLDVTAAQLSILSAYNDPQVREPKTLKQLENISRLSISELRRALWSLVSNPKLKIQLMNCDPKLSSVKDLDNEANKYSINYNFVLVKNGKPKPRGRISLIGRLQI